MPGISWPGLSIPGLSIPGLGGVGGFWRALSEIDPDAIAAQAIEHVAIVIVGRPGVGKRTLRNALLQLDEVSKEATASGGLIPIVEVRPNEKLEWLPGGHLYLHVVDGGRGIEPDEIVAGRELVARGFRVIHVVNKADQLGSPDAFRYTAGSAFDIVPGDHLALTVATDHGSLKRELIPKISHILHDRVLALARTFPGMRESIAQQLVFDSARTNAQFALLSSLPANVPIIGALTSVAADSIILTKNQAMLLLKLAVVHGRPLDAKIQIAAEIMPIIGAAFLWRSIARSLIGLLPGILSAIPKAGVAFAGTYAVGETAHYYYRMGHRPDSAALDRIAKEAVAMAKRSVGLTTRDK